ncbi:nucleotidyltransferase family protein [Acholeplasma equirhinis]|uniref:nucleotidyltransferase domain-containing protein n=1 Tax=Acholeplasma equirhinis TaxID=555393 RepID=UPI00197AE9C7|nr:nucleotidyltransferase family protein [Acholeplasma equirhinis]MBN3489964.1 nucleotidyltransferase family protein [Acholeplasma equirhinis]
MDNKQITFQLIEAAFKGDKVKFESEDEKGLLKLLFENGLIGLVFNSVDKASFKDQNLYKRMREIHASFIAKDIQQTEIINQIKHAFNEAKIDHIFLKGAHLKSMYPMSYMRGMGDIDLLVRERDFEDAKNMMQRLGYIFKSAESHHHVYETLDGNSIELHQSLASYLEPEFKSLLQQAWDFIIQGDSFTKQLEPEFEYLHLLIHLVRHIRTSGVGIRSVLDLEVFAKYQTLETEKLFNLLSLTSLIEFNDKVNHLNQIFMHSIHMNESDQEVVDYIIHAGIHGNGTEHDRYLTKRTYQKTKQKKGRIRYLLGEIFPSRDRLKEGYPYLKKHSWLLPWAWFVRILKQLFKPKNTIKRIESVSSDKNMDKVERIYTYLGL